MTKYSKFNDIDAVLKKVKSTLDLIEQKYNESLHEQEISSELLVEIKDYLGNLRSALDYIWNKISSGYFPIANSSADFSAKTSSIDQKYTNVLQKYQDYDSNSWIRCFSLFRNKNIHITLVPQKRIETPSLNIEHNGVGIRMSGGATIQMGKGASMSLGGAVIPGGQVISANSKGLIGDPRLNVKKEIWVDFVFDGSSISSDFPKNISALPFLKKCFENVPQIISDIETILDK